jgi:hypothetical protein
LSVDFVDFGYIQCCIWPHRNKPKARGVQALAIPNVIISVLGITTFNSGVIKGWEKRFKRIMVRW